MQRRVPQLVYTNKTGDCLFICLSVYLFGYGRPNCKAYWAEIWKIDVKSPDDECGLNNSIIVVACLDRGAGNSFFFFNLGASAGDCNDPGEGGKEGGRGGEGEMGRGETGRERQGCRNREGETGMGKREVLARVGSMEGETGRVRLEGGNGEGEGSNGKTYLPTYIHTYIHF